MLGCMHWSTQRFMPIWRRAQRPASAMLKNSLGVKSELLTEGLQRMRNTALKERLSYRKHGDIDKLLEITLPCGTACPAIQCRPAWALCKHPFAFSS